MPRTSSPAALARLIDRVRCAADRGTPLEVRGGGTKAFYGGMPRGEPLDTREFVGITEHEPSELVVSVRAGTPLVELEAALAEQGQCLPFEPPHFGPGATVGGMVAAGLAGPARATTGSVRDFVLGCTLVNGRGEWLTYGGQVMKNVAGYDVSRLMVGSLGILGVLCEVSLKVLPMPASTLTLRFDFDQRAALDRLAQWRAQPLPLHATAWQDGVLHVRLRGAVATVHGAARSLGGTPLEADAAQALWVGLREQTTAFFTDAAASGLPLWRLSVPPAAAPLALDAPQLIEWGGGQRWVASSLPCEALRAAAARAGGHATLFRAAARVRTAAAGAEMLAPALQDIHRRLKDAFDPRHILNPGRLCPDF